MNQATQIIENKQNGTKSQRVMFKSEIKNCSKTRYIYFSSPCSTVVNNPSKCLKKHDFNDLGTNS